MTQREWLEIGKSNGWCDELFCYTHDAPQMTDDEVHELDNNDFCLWVVRVYEPNV